MPIKPALLLCNEGRLLTTSVLVEGFCLAYERMEVRSVVASNKKKNTLISFISGSAVLRIAPST